MRRRDVLPPRRAKFYAHGQTTKCIMSAAARERQDMGAE
jgi:hypothetical protein